MVSHSNIYHIQEPRSLPMIYSQQRFLMNYQQYALTCENCGGIGHSYDTCSSFPQQDPYPQKCYVLQDQPPSSQFTYHHQEDFYRAIPNQDPRFSYEGQPFDPNYEYQQFLPPPKPDFQRPPQQNNQTYTPPHQNFQQQNSYPPSQQQPYQPPFIEPSNDNSFIERMLKEMDARAQQREALQDQQLEDLRIVLANVQAHQRTLDSYMTNQGASNTQRSPHSYEPQDDEHFVLEEIEVEKLSNNEDSRHKKFMNLAKNMETTSLSMEEKPPYTNFLAKVTLNQMNFNDREKEDVCVNGKCGEEVKSWEMEVDELELAIHGELRSYDKNYDACSFDSSLEEIEALIFGKNSVHLESQRNVDISDNIMNLNVEKLTPLPFISHHSTHLGDHEEVSSYYEVYELPLPLPSSYYFEMKGTRNGAKKSKKKNDNKLWRRIWVWHTITFGYLCLFEAFARTFDRLLRALCDMLLEKSSLEVLLMKRFGGVT